MSVHSKVNVAYKFSSTLMVLPPSWDGAPPSMSGVISYRLVERCLLPLPFGIGHETDIFSLHNFMILFCWNSFFVFAGDEISYKTHHLSGLIGLFISRADFLQF